MSRYIRTKDVKQCKSYDERMKQDNFDKKGLDIPQYVEREIQVYSSKDSEVVRMLNDFNIVRKTKSPHMEFLDERMKQLRETDQKLKLLLRSIDRHI